MLHASGIDGRPQNDASSEIVVRTARFGEWFHFEIRPLDQFAWSTDISMRTERSIARVMAAIADDYNNALPYDIPMLFITAMGVEEQLMRPDFVDVSDVYADVHEKLADFPSVALPYTVFATKRPEALAHLIESLGVFGMVFPAGIRSDLWLQIGENSWDFVLNDPASGSLPDRVLAVFAEEGLRLVPCGPSTSINRKCHAEDTVADFERAERTTRNADMSREIRFRK